MPGVTCKPVATEQCVALAALALVACASSAESVFPECDGKCDSDGPLTVSSRWVPRTGFVRAKITGDHELHVEPSEGITIEPAAHGSIVRFAYEGFYAIEARAAGRVAGSLHVRVSDDGPEIVVSPVAGALATRAGTTVHVTGYARDPLGGALTLEIAGARVRLGTAEVHVDVGRRASPD